MGAKHVLFLFLDGVGLGANDPQANPFAAAKLPTFEKLLGEARLLAGQAPIESTQATLLAIDAQLGVPGMPQSATGQAALLTGKNVPALIGEHYGPKPNPVIEKMLANGNLFSVLTKDGKKAALLNAFPPGYFEAIESGRRLPGAIAMAARYAGVALKTADDLYAGQAMSADFTGDGWRTMLGYPDLPLLTPPQAGARLAELAQAYHLAFFEHWPTDVVGHRQNMPAAIEILQTLDGVLAGLLPRWQAEEGLILITSDHGNMEDLDTRRHTRNTVPCMVIGALALRRRFTRSLEDLTGIYPAILDVLDS
jgi:hypothetical protein